MTVANNRTEEGPFLYARVLGVFHVIVTDKSQDIQHAAPTRVEFLWVRWFKMVSNSNGLPEVSYLPLTDRAALGFISPNDVVRACHVIPRFSQGRNIVLDGRGKPKRAISFVEHAGGDWNFYYVNR